MSPPLVLLFNFAVLKVRSKQLHKRIFFVLHSENICFKKRHVLYSLVDVKLDDPWCVGEKMPGSCTPPFGTVSNMSLCHYDSSKNLGSEPMTSCYIFGVDVDNIHRFSFRWGISRCAFGFCRRRRRFAQRKPVCLVRSACNRTRARAERGVCSLCGLAFGSFPRPLARSSQSHLPNGGRNSCQRRLAFLMGSNRSSEQLFDFILTLNSKSPGNLYPREIERLSTFHVIFPKVLNALSNRF